MLYLDKILAQLVHSLSLCLLGLLLVALRRPRLGLGALALAVIWTGTWYRVLLVASALHMPRALASFRAVGTDAVPAATDFEVMPEPNQILRRLPDARALADSTRALKEYLGLWMYQWCGWADRQPTRTRHPSSLTVAKGVPIMLERKDS